MSFIRPVGLPIYGSYSPGEFSTFFSASSAQGSLGIRPSNVGEVPMETVMIIPRGVGIPRTELYTSGVLNNPITSTMNFGNGSSLTCTVPTGANVFYITAMAEAYPNAYEQTNLVVEYNVTTGADNTMSAGTTVVSGYITTGIPQEISWDMYKNITSTTPMKKELNVAQAWYQVETTLSPDQFQQQSIRAYSIGSFNSTQPFIVVKNDSVSVTVTGALFPFNSTPVYVNLAIPNRVSLSEIPTITVPDGYGCIAACLQYTTSSLGIVYVNNPVASLQGKRLTNDYDGLTWLCSIVYQKQGGMYPQIFSLGVIVTTIVGARAILFQSLNGNQVYVNGTGKAYPVDGEWFSVYGMPRQPLQDETSWMETVNAFNDPRNKESLRQSLISGKVGKSLEKRIREEH